MELRSGPGSADVVLVDLKVRATRVARLAAKHAATVDSAGRFPHELVAALKPERLLGIFVPKSLGGYGASLSEVRTGGDSRWEDLLLIPQSRF